MTNKEKYVKAMNNLEFKKNLKEEILTNVYEKIEYKYLGLPKKILISFAFTELIFCFFSTTSGGCFI